MPMAFIRNISIVFPCTYCNLDYLLIVFVNIYYLILKYHNHLIDELNININVLVYVNI